MSRAPESSARASETDLVGAGADGGMKVPEAIRAISHSVPSSIPPEMFGEAPPSEAPVADAPPPPPLPRNTLRMPKADPVAAVPQALPPPPPMVTQALAAFEAQAMPPAPSAPTLHAIAAPVARDPYGEPEPASIDTSEIAIAGLRRRKASRALGVVGACLAAALTFVVVHAAMRAVRARAASRATASQVVAATTATTATASTAATLPPPDPEPKEAPAPVDPAPAPPPGESASNAASTSVPAGMGYVKTSAARPGHRIFVDRHTAGETPKPVLVKCGEHRVRIGSGGKTMKVDVPCGGEIDVSAP